MDLRLRLNLVLSIILFVGLLAGTAYSLTVAREAVLDELRASTILASDIVGVLASASMNDEDAWFQALRERLEATTTTRHLRISFDAVSQIGASDSGEMADVPDWFSRLVRPDPGALTQVVSTGARQVVIEADPRHEIEEAWRESRATLTLLLGTFIVANLVVFVFVGRALRPLDAVSGALTEVAKGDYSAHLSMTGLPEIDRISERVNAVAEVLAQSERENAALTKRSIAIQEEERRKLAHELHDEMGQSITAIKALAVSIREQTTETDPGCAQSATTITEVSGKIYSRVRQMMTRLHPVILDELGLVSALDLMVDDWNNHHSETFCRLSAAANLPSLAPEARIAVYRIVQEGLTNIARHADASEVSVTVETATDKQGDVCLIGEVSDNGRGYDVATTRRGLGLVGINERVVALGGRLAIQAEPGTGTVIRFSAPLAGIQERTDHG